jgi:aspartate aminotransferase
MPALRDAIVRLFAKDLGLDYPADGVVVAGGARPIIYATYRALVNPGDPRRVSGAVVERPDHYRPPDGCEGRSDRNGPGHAPFLPDAAMLRPHRRDARMLALCSAPKPDGHLLRRREPEGDLPISCSRKTRAAGFPRRTAAATSMYDQVYWMLTFGGTRHVTPVGLDPRMAPWTIFVDGASKGFAATGLRAFSSASAPRHREAHRTPSATWEHGRRAPEQVAVAGFLDDSAGDGGITAPPSTEASISVSNFSTRASNR